MDKLSILKGYVDGEKIQLFVSDGEHCARGSDFSATLGQADHYIHKDLPALLISEELEDFLSLGWGMIESGKRTLEISQIHLLSPISENSKILCAGFNYAKHNAENKLANPSIPYFFQRLFTTVIGPFEEIQKPKVTMKMDYETELAVMIGKKGKNIQVDDAKEYVAGYFVVNDVSFRDYQFNEYNPDITKTFGQNWLYGKNMDRSFPSGPCFMPITMNKQEHFEIETRVNGTKVQGASTSEMIFNISELIHYASRGVTLLPGDVISTGTPDGTAKGGGHAYLVDGDIVESTVKGIGTIKNLVVDEK